MGCENPYSIFYTNTEAREAVVELCHFINNLSDNRLKKKYDLRFKCNMILRNVYKLHPWTLTSPGRTLMEQLYWVGKE